MVSDTNRETLHEPVERGPPDRGEAALGRGEVPPGGGVYPVPGPAEGSRALPDAGTAAGVADFADSPSEPAGPRHGAMPTPDTGPVRAGTRNTPSPRTARGTGRAGCVSHVMSVDTAVRSPAHVT